MTDKDGPAGNRRKGGRPPLPPEKRRSETVDVRVTSAEVRTISNRAAAAGLCLRDFVRRAALGVRIIAPADQVTLAHAMRLVEIGRTLARIERLALAGRIVGLPTHEIDDLRRLAEAAAVAVLGVDTSCDEGSGAPCLP